MENLIKKIESLIEVERRNNSDLQFLDISHAKLIAQIISNYNLKPSEEEFPSAEMIFLGAPTGAGKDILVRKIMADNKDKRYVVLNMDIFRYYHYIISGNNDHILDKDYAVKTNQSSYELYYIIQEIILEYFPGTNVIVTGTIKDLTWVKNIMETYKNNSKTNYKISLITLAVPSTESAISIYERYLNMVELRDDSNAPIRYTDLEYHNNTIKKFVSNIESFENDLTNNPNSLIDSIKVYKRNKDISNTNEDNLIYNSDTSNFETTATNIIYEIMNSAPEIDSNRISRLFSIISKNKDYLESQELYTTIIEIFDSILPQEVLEQCKK